MIKLRHGAEYYSSLDEVLVDGKLKGMKIRDVLEHQKAYLLDRYHHGTLDLSEELLILARDAKREYVMTRAHSGDPIKSVQTFNASTVKHENAMAKIKKEKGGLGSGDECIHEACYCAQHGCSHKGRKVCDAERLHREGASDCHYSRNEEWKRH